MHQRTARPSVAEDARAAEVFAQVNTWPPEHGLRRHARLGSARRRG